MTDEERLGHLSTLIHTGLVGLKRVRDLLPRLDKNEVRHRANTVGFDYTRSVNGTEHFILRLPALLIIHLHKRRAPAAEIELVERAATLALLERSDESAPVRFRLDGAQSGRWVSSSSSMLSVLKKAP